MDIDVLPNDPHRSASIVTRDLPLHADSFFMEEEAVAEFSYRRFVEEQGIDPDNEIYTPQDYISAFQTVRTALTDWGHNPISSAHAVNRGGKRYGALISFLPQNPGAFREMGRFGRYVPLVFLRSSYDKTYPFTIHVGAHLHEADVLWISRSDVGQRRHTKHFDADLYDVVTEWMHRLDDLLVEQEHRFSEYSDVLLRDMAQVHDLIFYAYDAGVLTKSYLPDARDAFADEQGESGPWDLFTVMQYPLKVRRGKDIHQYRRFCGEYEDALDERAGFHREVRIATE